MASYTRIIERIRFVAEVEPTDVLACVILIILVLERAAGSWVGACPSWASSPSPTPFSATSCRATWGTAR